MFKSKFSLTYDPIAEVYCIYEHKWWSFFKKDTMLFFKNVKVAYVYLYGLNDLGYLPGRQS